MVFRIRKMNELENLQEVEFIEIDGRFGTGAERRVKNDS